MIIHERYCSYELSKLLKEKGFDILTDMVYCEVNQYRCPFEYKANIEGKGYYLCPTHQMAIDWICENFNIWITTAPMINEDNKWSADIYVKKTFNSLKWLMPFCGELSFCDTPEESIEEAIKYVLEKMV